MGAIVVFLAVWSLIPLGVLLSRVHSGGGVLTGADGGLAGSDQFLYLDWIRQSGDHWLIGNRFDLAPVDEVLLQPVYLLGGLLWRAGAGLELSLLALKPLGVAVLAYGCWTYVRRLVPPGGAARPAALLLGLFAFSPLVPLLAWTDAVNGFEKFALLLVAGDAMPAWATWGYPHTAVTLGLVPLCLLGMERVLDPERRRPGRSGAWYLAWTTAGALLVSWIHPWQGLTLLLVAAGLAVWARRWRPRWELLLPAAAILAPLAYYYVLTHTVPAWELDNRQNAVPRVRLWILGAGLLPLILAALPGVRRTRLDVAEKTLLLWPVSALAVYFLFESFPYHALEAITVPLGILAVRGWRRLRLPRLAGAAAVAALTLPGMAFALDTLRANVNSDIAPYAFEPGERDALRYVEASPRDGGVLARYYLGMAVPSYTGRQTWLGQYPWTPDFPNRQARVDALFAGDMAPAAARRMVARIGPAFLLTDCRTQVDMRPVLGPLVGGVRRFGCARVYEVRARPL